VIGSRADLMPADVTLTRRARLPSPKAGSAIIFLSLKICFLLQFSVKCRQLQVYLPESVNQSRYGVEKPRHYCTSNLSKFFVADKEPRCLQMKKFALNPKLYFSKA
jgi:hypothetical protein